MRLSFLPTNILRASCLALLLALGAVPLPAQERAAGVLRYEATHAAMGTVFTVIAYGDDQAYLSEVAAEVFNEIDDLDIQMSNYQPASQISQINREAARGPVLVEPRLFQLIEDAVRVSAETGGAFDITVGPLMKAWGFFRGQGRLPVPTELAAALKRVGYRGLDLNTADRTIQFRQAGMEIDLGGIAKGYAVDRVVEMLRARGIRAALVSSGTSSVFALGAPPGERGWKITVRSPHDARKPGDIVWLRDLSLSISGNYEKFFRLSGRLYCHILDPRTGRPVDKMLSAVAIGGRAVETDALSTAFFVMGAEGCRRYLNTHPNLTGILYQPATTSNSFRRMVLRSPSYSLPSGTWVELESERPVPAPTKLP